jgi:hypothetical protein
MLGSREVVEMPQTKNPIVTSAESYNSRSSRDDDNDDGGGGGGGGGDDEEQGTAADEGVGDGDVASHTMLFVIERCEAVFGMKAPEWWPQQCSRRSRRRSSSEAATGAASATTSTTMETPWWRSPPKLWFLMVRLTMLTAVAGSTFNMVYFEKTVFRYAFALPALTAILVTFATTVSPLPQKFREAVADATLPSASTGHITPTCVESAASFSLAFSVGWSVLSIIVGTVWTVLVSSGVENLKTDDDFSSNGYRFSLCTQVLFAISTIPSIGAILFCLSLDVSKAYAWISRLIRAAQDRPPTLTVEKYRQANEAIRKISQSWQAALWLLALAALYNTVAMLIYLVHNDANEKYSDDYAYKKSGMSFLHYNIMNDFFTVAQMGKEVMLLFTFTYLTKIVNDMADDVVTDVFFWPKKQQQQQQQPLLLSVFASEVGGSGGSMEGPTSSSSSSSNELELQIERVSFEVRRLLILAEGSSENLVTPEDPRKRRHSCDRVMWGHPRGITWKVLSIRWTSRRMVILVGSFLLSIASVIVGKYNHMIH